MVKVYGMLRIEFTGWVDVDLSEEGILEAQKSGQLIKKGLQY